MQTHSKLFLLASLMLACLPLSGCLNTEMTDADAALPPVQPTVTVTPLLSKPLGDNGRTLTRQNEDQSGDGAAPASNVVALAKLMVTQWTPVDRLTPLGSSPGIVICEPVASGSSPGIAEFGAGCGRWLHFAVGGQPEFGRTPLWSSLSRAETEMNRKTLRLTPGDAFKLGGILGVTHAATGQISGNASRCTLAYQLWSLPADSAVGLPIQVTGTQTQVLAQLPQLARGLAGRLGLIHPRLPLSVAATPAAMTLIGHLPWYPEDDLPTAQVSQLKALSQQMPLANFFLINSTNLLSDSQWDTAAKAMLQQQPDNPLVWAQVGRSEPALLNAFPTQMVRHRQQFPQNYLFAAADAWVQRKFQHGNAERLAAERTVRCAPQNPDAWLTLGWTVSDEGNHLRNGRFASDITPKEWAFLNTVYSQWLYAVRQSTKLDPLYADAWQRVTQAATFAEDNQLADEALWKDIALDADSPYAYAWGLQMYQEKWDGDADKLAKVAHLLATHNYPEISQGLYAASLLKDNEQENGQFRDDRLMLINTILVKTQQAIAANPGDAQAHYNQANALELAGRMQLAIQEYKNVIVLRPTDPLAHHDLAAAYEKSEQTELAIAEYRQVLRLQPQAAQSHLDLGWTLKHGGHFVEAELELNKSLQIDPSQPQVYDGLGQIYQQQHQNVKAIQAFQQATRLSPFIVGSYQALCYLYDVQGHYAQAIAAGERVLKYNPTDNETLDNTADCYLHLHDYKACLTLSQEAIDANANDPCAHINMGEGYIGLGDKVHARAEWNKTLALDHGQLAQSAQKELAKYP